VATFALGSFAAFIGLTTSGKHTVFAYDFDPLDNAWTQLT
jgi:hypothetical protein